MSDRPLRDTLQFLGVKKPDQDTFCEKTVRAIYTSDETFDWVGIYLVKDSTLELPGTYYQGTEPEHKIIPFEEGICGAAATRRETIIVDDVTKDPRYLACSIFTQSEIVIPVMSGDTVYGVLDLDSNTPAAFGGDAQKTLEFAAKILAQYFRNQGVTVPAN